MGVKGVERTSEQPHTAIAWLQIAQLSGSRSAVEQAYQAG